ncbi:MAG: hypothetical protein IKP04_05455 [Candidatus Methanomethylophilaceae archaeon]|nr:hypothetical protein [Candidatus Methanomethylophilaceae archaeon]
MIEQYIPFKTGLISHAVESEIVQSSFIHAGDKLDGFALIEGQCVPGCCIYLGYNLSGRDGYAVVFHMLDDCVTLSSYEYGDLKSVVANT